jgi:ketosteroid isomerase-like protein
MLLAGLCATVLLYATARMWTARARPAGTDTGPLAIPTAVEPAAPVTSAAPSPPATAQSIEPVGAAAPPAAPPENTGFGRRDDSRREVRAAFAGWIDSTNRGHVASHIEWYADPVPVFYNAKNVSRSAVLTLRRKTFAEANRIEVRTNEPEIHLAGDENIATMVFRKTYRFEGPRTDRRGAVLQELTWRKTDDGWRIIGERTLRELPRRGAP